MSNDEILINESLKEDSFSSTVHSCNAMTYDNPIVKSDDIKIPERYYKNRVTLLGVNTATYYIYWEMTQEFIATFKDRRDEFFTFRVLNDKNTLLDEFSSPFDMGDYSLNKSYENMNIHIQVGYFTPLHIFKTIMVSNTIHTFSNELKFTDSDHEVWIKKEGGWTEIIRSSLTHFTLGFSSAQYATEIERLKEFSKTSISSMSSTTLAKGQ